MRGTGLASSILVVALMVFPILLQSSVVRAQDATPSAATAHLEMVASGLTNPRGFTWSADGTLYMALAGWGGDTRIPVREGFTVNLGLSSSVVTVADSCTTPVVQGLVSTKWEEADWVWGAMDVAFLGDELYVLVSGAGPTSISPSSISSVFRVNEGGVMTMVADITDWLPEQPPQVIAPDYNADGSLFDLEAGTDALYFPVAVGGQIVKMTPAGEISSIVDLSQEPQVPSGIAIDPDGNIYVDYKNAIPYPNGASKVSKIAPDGTVTDFWTGLTRVSDVALGPDGVLYAAELSTNNTDTEPYVHSGTGRIVKQTGPDSLKVLVDGLDFPAYLGFGPDGALYVTGPATGASNGEGWLAKVVMGGEVSSPEAAPAC